MADDRPPWRKVLYAQQPYPDNHTDASFLAAISNGRLVYESPPNGFPAHSRRTS